jgi:predicted Mrr-cat superfamily restriction endonuclease
MSTQTIWGIHAGKTGDAHSLFLNRNVVAVGWTAMGDLSAIPSNRDAFKAAVAKTYPTAKPGAIPNNAGQLFRFVTHGELILSVALAAADAKILRGLQIQSSAGHPGQLRPQPRDDEVG